MAEVHSHVGFVVGVFKVVDPHGCVGINVHYVGVKEIIFAGEAASYGFTYDFPLVVQICRVFRNYGYICRDGTVGVIFAFARVEAVTAFHGLGLVVDLVAVVELFGVKFACPCYGVGAVEAFNGACLVFPGVSPGYRLVPVEMWRYGVALFVFLDFVFLIASESRVGKAFADNGVANPEYKLLVFRVGYFGFIHPKGINRHPFGVGCKVPGAVGFLRPHLHGATAYEHHAVGCRFGP